MKSRNCLFLICFFMPNIQFGMEDDDKSIEYSCDFGIPIQKHKFEDACNTIRKAVEKNELSLLVSPIGYFIELQKKMPLSDEIKNVMTQYPSPLIYILKEIQKYDSFSRQLEDLSKDLMVGSDISDQINQCQQLRDRYYQLLKLLCSKIPFLCSSVWNGTDDTPLLCAASSQIPMEKEIRLLLHYNADPYENVSNPEGYKNPLEAATALGYASIVDLLIKYNNKSKEKTVEDPITRVGFSSITGPSKTKIKKTHKKLLELVKLNDLKGFKKIIDKDYININYVYYNDKDGYKYLLAYLLDNYFVQRQLFAIIMDQPSNILVKGAVDDYYGAAQDMLFYFLSKKPNLNTEYTYNQSKEDIRNQTDQTPLKEAIKYNVRPLIIKLLEAGADPDYKDIDTDQTPLEFAHEQNPELALFIKTLLQERPKKDLLTASE